MTVPVLEGVQPVVGAEPLPQEPVDTREPELPPAPMPEQIVPPEAGPEPVAGLSTGESLSPAVAEESLADAGRVAEVASGVPAPPPRAAQRSRLWRALPWAAGGSVILLLVCVVAAAAVRLPRSASGIDVAALQLSALLPGGLILISVTSFVGAALLLALLFWARRRDST